MDMEIVKTLRKRCSVRGKKQTWISTLNDGQLWIIFIRLRNGESLKAIAEDIQERWGIMPDSSIKSISQGISKFKKRISDILLFPAPVEIEEVGELDGLMTARKVLMESIQIKGHGNANLAKESKVLLEINNTIERLKEQEEERNDPENFLIIATNIIKNLDDESTEKWVEAVLMTAERKLDAIFHVGVYYGPIDLVLFNRARKTISHVLQEFMKLLKERQRKAPERKITDTEIENSERQGVDMSPRFNKGEYPKIEWKTFLPGQRNN